MKHIFLKTCLPAVALGISLFAMFGCEKSLKPTVTTSEIISISDSGVVIGGDITDDHGFEILIKGLCWTTEESPNYFYNDTLICGDGMGSFTATITGLTPNRDYNIRAFAVNAEGVGYGVMRTFTTTGLPTLSTGKSSDVTTNSASIDVTLSAEGGSDIIRRGICWSASLNPEADVDDMILSSSTDTLFTCNIEGLSSGSLYYARGFAENSSGIGYGENVIINTYTGEVVVDADGNEYDVIVIGGEEWLTSNLTTTKYSNGDDIYFMSDSLEWITHDTLAYCWYGNDADGNGAKYGALYNWNAVNSGDLCPSSWHVASAAEWQSLISSVGIGNAGQIKSMGTDDWLEYDGAEATNDYLFSALPGGYRSTSAMYKNAGQVAYWWTSSEVNAGYATTIDVSYNSSSIIVGSNQKGLGLSVRCVKD